MKLILFILLLIFNAIDTYQTWLLIDVGLEEWNPIVNFMINEFGFFTGVIGFKTIWLTLLGLILMKQWKENYK